MHSGMTVAIADHVSILRWESEGGSLAAPILMPSRLYRTVEFAINTSGRFAKLRNDDGIAEILIGMKEFECIGASPPHDHPHVYLNMGLSDSMLCPYCATEFCFAPALAPCGVSPVNCRYS